MVNLWLHHRRAKPARAMDATLAIVRATTASRPAW